MNKSKNISTFELEKDFLERGYAFAIGVDEVGRGPLCGPVVACAAALRNNQTIYNHQDPNDQKIPDIKHEIQDAEMWDLVRDSKKLSEKQREKVFDFICENFHVGVGLCDHQTIDRINILEASFLAMKKAIQELLRNPEISKSYKLTAKSCILVDGNKEIPNLSMEQKAVIGGDKFVKSISAASIVAKVTRDRMMHEFAKKYPGYGMEKHMGYGTKMHLDALNQLGPCEIHRKSFAPVTRLLRCSTSGRPVCYASQSKAGKKKP